MVPSVLPTTVGGRIGTGGIELFLIGLAVYRFYWPPMPLLRLMTANQTECRHRMRRISYLEGRRADIVPVPIRQIVELQSAVVMTMF
jgi:hypothetical protein